MGIVGQVGCGKSSLLSAVLGEVHRKAGHVTLSTDAREEGIGLFSQEAWLQHATLRDNILFGQSYNPRRYQAVIDACALNDDLQARFFFRRLVCQRGVLKAVGQVLGKLVLLSNHFTH